MLGHLYLQLQQHHVHLHNSCSGATSFSSFQVLQHYNHLSSGNTPTSSFSFSFSSTPFSAISTSSFSSTTYTYTTAAAVPRRSRVFRFCSTTTTSPVALRRPPASASASVAHHFKPSLPPVSAAPRTPTQQLQRCHVVLEFSGSAALQPCLLWPSDALHHLLHLNYHSILT